MHMSPGITTVTSEINMKAASTTYADTNPANNQPKLTLNTYTCFL